MNILVVEDELSLAEGLRFNLEAEGFSVELAANGDIALARVLESKFDALVLDVMMPGLTGFDVARIMRERGDYTPILMLTALGQPEDVLKGFEAGADDYLPKPFDLSILLARVSGLLRRNRWSRDGTSNETKGVVTINGRRIDLDNLELMIGDQVARLTLMEAKLLGYLIENEGRTVSRNAMLEDVWQLQEDTDTRAIDNFVVRLRRLLEDDPSEPKIIETVRGVGYRFREPSE